MSSTGTAGSVTLAAHQRNHSMAADHRYGLPPGPDGRNGASGPRVPPLPHIDDILSAPDDIDPHNSVRRLLELAGASLRLAEMSRGVNRPAQALKEYVRASIIAVQVIAKHRDYPALQSVPGELGRQHTALLKKLKELNDEYTKIKQEIMADNQRSGVQPMNRRPNQGRSTGQGTQPAVQLPPPQPSTMDRNTVKPGHGRAASVGGTAQDSLFNRFSTLRGPQSVPGQDPRIKTHTIVPPEHPPPPPPASGPKGPREMPRPQRPTVDPNTSVPTLPKMPDAIYSPARGSISGDSTRAPPPSTPRGSYSRTGSSTSLNNIVAMPQQQSQKSDYFGSTQSTAERTNSVPASKVPQNIAEKTVVSAEELYQLIKSKASLLIIDIRSREDFDAGHIWTQNTICIDREILDRGDQSAAQIGESLIISSNQEQRAFEERSKYEIVVFHDQDSGEVPKLPRDPTDLALIRLQRALTDFDYDASKLKNPPKLLQGGLDAWVDFMGPSSIQSTSGSVAVPSRPNNFAHNPRQRRKSNYTVKLDSEEVKTWQEIVKQDNLDTASSPAYVRSPEEFLRRYPPVVTERESMMSSGTASRAPQYGSSHAGDLRTELPTPPSRPPPALPRPSFSGVSQSADDDSAYDDTGTIQPQRTPGRAKQPEQGPADAPRVYTGLDNPSAWCYANSSLQALLASPGFGRELADASWQENHRVPRKAGEKMEHPQLMMRIMSNLFHWMSTGKFHSMKAQTLMDYSRHVHKQNRGSPMFGGTEQQDASEFLLFLFDNLHEETNTHRNIEARLSQPNTKNKTILHAAEEYWGNHLASSYSIVDRYWRGLDLSTVCCQLCNTRTYTFSVFDTLILYLRENGPPMTLSTALDHYASTNTIDKFQCDNCKTHTRASQYACIARMPRLLCVVLNRAAQDGKTHRNVTWDLNDFDFAPWFMRSPDANGQQQMSSPWRYECYAVVVHKGSTMYSGHYYTYVRDPNTFGQSSWLLCNDTQVSKVPDMSRVQRDWNGGTPFLLFFRRK